MMKWKYSSLVKRNIRGVTLVELMMSVAILGIITPVLVMLLTYLTNGFTQYEAALSLRQTNQNTLNRIYLRLGSTKRLFQNDATGNTFLSSIDLSSAPAVLTGSKLPIVQPTGTLEVGSANFVPADVGNSLFFANYERTVVLTTTTTYRIDTYRFNYYYLTPVNPYALRSTSTYALVEWRSAEYADYSELQALPLATQSFIVQGLANSTTSAKVMFAFDTSQSTTTHAFYSLNIDGTTTDLLGGHHPPPMTLLNGNKYRTLTQMMTSILLGGYRYGISCNSGGWAAAPKTVPIYATAANPFPAGFEVAIAGPAGGRVVLLRSVLVAQGSMKGTIGDELQVEASAKDLW